MAAEKTRIKIIRPDRPAKPDVLPIPKVWTPEREELVAMLWVQGKSAAQICKSLQESGVDVSRSSVIGKVHRLGLPPHEGVQMARLQGRRAAKIGRSKRARPASKIASTKVDRSTVRAAEPVLRVEPYEEAPEALAPTLDGNGRPFARISDLALAQCKWPIGDPAVIGFAFCGRATGGARVNYCPEHRQKGAMPASAQARVNANLKAVKAKSRL